MACRKVCLFGARLEITLPYNPKFAARGHECRISAKTSLGVPTPEAAPKERPSPLPNLPCPAQIWALRRQVKTLLIENRSSKLEDET